VAKPNLPFSNPTRTSSSISSRSKAWVIGMMMDCAMLFVAKTLSAESAHRWSHFTDSMSTLVIYRHLLLCFIYIN
jgi:hypothetical protein